MHRFIILSILSTLLLVSCKSFDDYSPHSKFVLKNEAMLFRGAEFDSQKAHILKLEEVKPIEEYPDYLRYNFLYNAQEENLLELEYFFNNDNKLDMIIAYYTLEDETEQALLFDEIMREFTKRFGPGERDELGWYTWKFNDKRGTPGLIEIILNTDNNAKGQRGIDIELVKYYDFEQNLELETERAG